MGYPILVSPTLLSALLSYDFYVPKQKHESVCECSLGSILPSTVLQWQSIRCRAAFLVCELKWEMCPEQGRRCCNI